MDDHVGGGSARSWGWDGGGSAPQSNLCLPLCTSKRTLDISHNTLNFLSSKAAIYNLLKLNVHAELLLVNTSLGIF